MRWLIDEGADLEVRDNKGLTVLTYACESGKPEIEEMILETNVDSYFEDVLAYIGYPKIVAMCLERGADANARHKRTGLTALHLAVEKGNSETAKLLIEYGADVNAREGDVRNEKGVAIRAGNNNTPLAEAATHLLTRMTDILIEAGADVNAQSSGGFTPLMVAAGRGRTAVVKKLIEAGADVNVKAGNGKTALSLAAGRGYTETAEVIREHIK